MANEFKITRTIQYANGKLANDFKPGSISSPQATQGLDGKVVTVNSSAEEDLDLSALGTPGKLIIQSLEATSTGNFISYGPKTSTGGMLKLAQLDPLDIHEIRMNSTSTLRCQANTAAVNVYFLAYEA